MLRLMFGACAAFALAACQSVNHASELASGKGKDFRSWKVKCEDAEDDNGDKGTFKLTPVFSHIGGDPTHDAVLKDKKNGQVLTIVLLDCKFPDGEEAAFKCKTDDRYMDDDDKRSKLEAKFDGGKLEISVKDKEHKKITKIKADKKDCKAKRVEDKDDGDWSEG